MLKLVIENLEVYYFDLNSKNERDDQLVEFCQQDSFLIFSTSALKNCTKAFGFKTEIQQVAG